MASTTPTARFPVFPGFYEFFFVFYEPLATFSPVFFYFFWPGKYGLYDMPRIEVLPQTTYLDSRAEMALYQMVNCHFLVVIFVSFVFQAARKNLANNPRAQESVVGAVLSALAIVDITHLLGMHFAVIPEATRYKPETWGSTIWISDAMVSLDFLVRLAWFAGVGRTRYYYGQPDTAEKLNLGIQETRRGSAAQRDALQPQAQTFEETPRALTTLPASPAILDLQGLGLLLGQTQFAVITIEWRSILSFTLALAVLAIARVVEAGQQPLQSSPSSDKTTLKGQGHPWMFDVEPSPNATHNLVFDTVANLLQQWPNTRYRNGHALVPVTVPVGTLLYHGTLQHKIPQVPEWVAVDPEHSYIYCVAQRGQDCWLLTLAVKKPLKLLYFDGSSAAKFRGPLDVQDILVWGKVIPERTMDEWSRILDLCRWGEKYGLDGFLRMSMDFEIMLCNFTERAEVVSFLNLQMDLFENPPGEMFLPVFRSLEAGHWHNSYPGDPRVKLDLSRLISFYDTEIFPGLVEARHGQERWDHRVEKLGEDREGRARLLDRLDEVLGADSLSPESGVDWSALIRIIVHRYADRLEVLRYLLNGIASANSTDTLKEAHSYITSMLAPYIVNSIRPRSPLPPDSTWAEPVFRNCAETHTTFISALPPSQLTTSEHLILGSIKGVLHEICRVVVGIWAEGVELGVDEGQLQNIPQVDWGVRVEQLMVWLDWSVWVKCTPECEFEEACWLPTWPGWPWTNHDNGDLPDPDDDYWRRPQPGCIRRVAPLKMV